MSSRYDAIVVGSGPNGLAAAITLARAGLSVLLLEGRNKVGGGIRSEELTLPGFLHDACSAIYPLAPASPFFQSLDLTSFGLEWIQPGLPLAHPLDDGEAACLHRSVEVTAAQLGMDKVAYQKLMTRFVEQSGALMPEVLQPMLHLPSHPFLMLKFGLVALQSAHRLCSNIFQQVEAKALFAGVAAHSFLPLGQRGSAAMGLVLNILAHSVGWPMPRGGAGKICDALTKCFQASGGTVQTGCLVTHIDELPKAKALFFDVSPRNLLSIAGHRFPKRYCNTLMRFKNGPGVFKIDYALNSPIPWRNRDCERAGTVHVGGTFEEVALCEDKVSHGEHSEKPFVLVTQPSRFDSSRAPDGKHIAWAYCHVPSGSTFDMTARIESQIERFAPGFRDCILKRNTRNCRDLELYNPNCLGGDISGGLTNLKQLLARPVFGRFPYMTPAKGIYLCSASTPPGGGVHGMCGYNAAQHALKTIFKV